MIAEKTFHVYRAATGDWTVRRPGAKPAHFSSRAEALKAARHDARKRSQFQIVIHTEDGHLATQQVHGFPAVQKPPQKSSLGTARISKAISDAVLRRLEAV